MRAKLPPMEFLKDCDQADMDEQPPPMEFLKDCDQQEWAGMDEQPPKDCDQQEWGLLERVKNAVEGHDLSNPADLALLVFPYTAAAPARFDLDNEGQFVYMGRTGYQNFQAKVLSLKPVNNPAFGRLQGFKTANLWGTMGSGKSYMLAALACALLSGLSRASPQWRRVVYIPSAEDLLEDHVAAVKLALMLGYSDDAESLSEIHAIPWKDERAVVDFFRKQAGRRICIFLLIDDCNALEESRRDSERDKQLKGAIEQFVTDLAYLHVSVRCASANNRNAMKWYRKQRRGIAVWHHGGLNEEEYENFKKHFSQWKSTSSSLQRLLDKDKADDEDEESRIKDATGCIPLYLKCWSSHNDSPEDAWERFITMAEISTASTELPEQIRDQLEDKIHGRKFLDNYIAFMTHTRTDAQPEDYDCRYLYVQEEDRRGNCTCGIVRRMIAQAIQESQHRSWMSQEAIMKELSASSRMENGKLQARQGLLRGRP